MPCLSSRVELLSGVAGVLDASTLYWSSPQVWRVVRFCWHWVSELLQCLFHIVSGHGDGAVPFL